MAMIRPFRGLRYTEKAGSLSELVAPPYDVLSDLERDALARKNAHNVVVLTLPEAKDDDRSKFVKYMRSASTLAEWRRDGVLALEPKPALYRYRQTFSVPGSRQTYTRTQMMALLKVEPYDKGVVLPHEQTFPKHKEDRLRLLEATRSHLECIYGLYEDAGAALHRAITEAPAESTHEIRPGDGVDNVLEVVTDPDALRAVCDAMADKRIWIADGHHRYETAVQFRAQLGERSELVAEDFMMMALSSMSDPGLVILPTHRIVQKLPFSEGEMDLKLQARFNVRKMPNSALLDALEAADRTDSRAIAVALPSGNGLLCTLDRPEDALRWLKGPESDRLKMLDVTILHQVIFEQLFDQTGHDFFAYTRDPAEALAAVHNGAAASFLMNPPTVDDMRVIALGGEKMPQKSTYYYPKLLSGLVLWSLEDFTP